MKNFNLLTMCLLAFSSGYSDIQISPQRDHFIQPSHAEIPALTGFTTEQNGQSFIQYNTYFSPILAIHPKNPDLLFCAMNQDLVGVISNAGRTVPRAQEVAIAYSTNGGNSWTADTIPLHRTLGGDLSNGQSVSSVQYSPLGGPSGTIFLAGRFSDLKNDHHRNNYSGIWITRSSDAGASWDPKVLVSVQESDAYSTFTGTCEGTPSLSYDPHQLSNLYLAWDRPAHATSANIFFSRSNDAGAFWSNPAQIYDITEDIPRGGQCAGVTLQAAIKKDTTNALLCSFMRYFTKPNATHLDKTVSTTFTDRVVIRSTDGGKSWSKHAIEISPFVYAQSHNPANSEPNTPVYPAPDGSEKAHMAVNPISGRIYLVWQAGSLSVKDPHLASQHPEIVLATSIDTGKEWSPPVTVSRTPKSLLTDNPKAYQAFNGNIIFIGKDLVGIVYNDYRQYESGSNVASCDTWLAVYKETTHKHSGSTHIGLDFVGEKRLTTTSFDANIATNNSVNGLVDGLGNMIGIACHDHSVHVAYPQTNPGQDSFDNIQIVNVAPQPDSTYEATVDTNRRISVTFEQLTLEP